MWQRSLRAKGMNENYASNVNKNKNFCGNEGKILLRNKDEGVHSRKLKFISPYVLFSENIGNIIPNGCPITFPT